MAGKKVQVGPRALQAKRKTLAARILSELDQRNWTQENLCKATGLSSFTVSWIVNEMHKTLPMTVTILKLAYALNLSCDYLLNVQRVRKSPMSKGERTLAESVR